MDIKYTDFNGAGALAQNQFQTEWLEIASTLKTLPLHLKASDQANIQGRPIFDPVGTNQYIASTLTHSAWLEKIAIPQDFSFLGTDIDFGKNGVVVEVQFSNYPFLLNNTLRSELFYRAQTIFHSVATSFIVIVTKAGMFPSSNSTLYYEQALKQLTALAQHKVFTVPIRLVGLFSPPGLTNAIWTEYEASRYSRAIRTQQNKQFVILDGGRGRSRISLA